jgi:hypothetical protein
MLVNPLASPKFNSALCQVHVENGSTLPDTHQLRSELINIHAVVDREEHLYAT